jgi:hypothetical protein
MVWVLIALFIPAAFVISLLARPAPIVDTSTQMGESTTIKVKDLAQEENLKAWLSKDELGTHFIEIELKKAMQHPLANFYLGKEKAADIKSYRLLGGVGAQGRQRFALDSVALSSPINYLLQYDPVRKEKIYTVQLDMQ